MAYYVNVLLISLLSLQAYAVEFPEVRVATLQFGTVNWEIDVIRHHQLDKKYNFSLDVTPVGGKNASAVALQSDAVDIIYGDWVWVNRQRFNRRMYSFSPVSTAAGGLYAQPDSHIETLTDIEGQRVGIAGGSVDKSWLLLQAYAKQETDKDLRAYIEPVFAAPPLLNKLMLDRKLPLSLNFWHYSARLEAKGFRPVITVDDIVKGLGVDTALPLVGWIFADEWKEKHSERLDNFLKASQEARQILIDSDEEWARIRPLTHAEDDAVFMALKRGYRAGVLQKFTVEELNSLNHIYKIMVSEGGDALTGGANTLDPELFYMPENDLDVSAKAEGGME